MAELSEAKNAWTLAYTSMHELGHPLQKHVRLTGIVPFFVPPTVRENAISAVQIIGRETNNQSWHSI